MVSLEGQGQNTDQLTSTEPKVSEETIEIVRELLKDPTKKNRRAALITLGVSKEEVNKMKMDELVVELAKFSIGKPEKGIKELVGLAAAKQKQIADVVAVEVAQAKQDVPVDASDSEKEELNKVAAEITTAGSDASQLIEEVQVAAAPGKPAAVTDSTKFLDELSGIEVDRDAEGKIIINDEMEDRFWENLGSKNNPENAAETARLALEKKAREVEDEAEIWFLGLDNINENDEKQLLQKIATLRAAVVEGKSDSDIQKAIEEVQTFQRGFKGSVSAVTKPEIVSSAPAKTGEKQKISTEQINLLLTALENGGIVATDTGEVIPVVRPMPVREFTGESVNPHTEQLPKNIPEAQKETADRLTAEQAKLIGKIQDNDKAIQGVANIVKELLKENTPKAEVPKPVTPGEIKNKLSAALNNLDGKVSNQQKGKIKYWQRQLKTSEKSADQNKIQQNVEEILGWLKAQGLDEINESVAPSQVGDLAINQPTPAAEPELVEELPDPVEKLTELQEKAERMHNHLVEISELLGTKQTTELEKHVAELERVKISDNPPEIQRAIAAAQKWRDKTFPKYSPDQTASVEPEPTEELPDPVEKLTELQEKAEALYDYLLKADVGDESNEEEVYSYRSTLRDAIDNNNPVKLRDLVVEVKNWLKKVQPNVDHTAILLGAELVEKAKAYVEKCKQEKKKPTTSALQRRLKIGYNKASRLLENVELDLVELETPTIYQQETYTEAEYKAQTEGIIRQCDFVDIHPADIMGQFEQQDWENIRRILTNHGLEANARLAAVKEIIRPRLAEILDRTKTTVDQDIVAEVVFNALNQHIKAERSQKLDQFDTIKARQIGFGVAGNVVRAMGVGAAVAATGLSGGIAAITTGAALAAWEVFKRSSPGKKLFKVLDVTIHGKSYSQQIEEKKEKVEQAVLAELTDDKLAALISNTLRRVSSEKWQQAENNGAEIETKLSKNPEDFKLWRQQAANMTEVQKLFFGQSLLELQEGEYAKESAETRLHMALQKTITAGMYDRTQQHQEVAMAKLSEDDPDKLKWLTKGLKKYGQVKKGEVEGWWGALATCGLGAATVYAIRETGWGRLAAGAIGGAMVGVSLVDRQQKKIELNIWKEMDKIIKEGESKIIDVTYPSDSARLDSLEADAQKVEAQWQMGIFKNNPLLQQRAENFIYHVKKLSAESTRNANELLAKVETHTNEVTRHAENQLEKIKTAVNKGRLTQVLQFTGAVASGAVLGYAGMRFSEWQMENNLGETLEKMPEPVQHQILAQLGLKGENIHNLTQDQLSQVFSGGKLSHGFDEMANKAYENYLVDEQGFKPNDFVAFSSDPTEKLVQLKLLEQNRGQGFSNEQLVNKVLAASADNNDKASAANAADIKNSKGQVAEPQGKIVENGEAKLDQEMVGKINAISDNPVIRQELTQSLAGKENGLEQLQALATAKTGLEGLPYNNEPLADHLMKEVGNDPEMFVQRVAAIEQVLGGPLAEHKLELASLIDKAARDGGADLEAVLNANRVMEVKAGDSLTKLLHQQFDLKDDSINHPELTKNFVNKYSGTTVENTEDVTQQLIDKAIGRAGVMQENLLHAGNKVIVTNSGIVETIKGEAALDSERVSEAALRTNYLTSILGVPKEDISDVRVSSGRSFEFTSHGQELRVSHAGTGHPEITVDVDGETIKLNLDHSGQVVGAAGVDLAEVKSLDNFVQQGPDSFVGKTVDANGQIEVNGTKFDFGENAQVRIHGISNEHVAAALPPGQTLPADAKFFVIKYVDADVKMAQVRFGDGDTKVFEAKTDTLAATGLRAELGAQAQYLQAARENIVNVYNMDQRAAAELLAVARRADGSVNTLLTETPNQPPAAIQRIMEAVGSKHEMLQRNGHFNVERIKLASTLTDEAHKFTPQETQSALEITCNTRLNDGTNLNLADAAVHKDVAKMQDVIGRNSKIDSIKVMGEQVIITAGKSTVTIQGPAAYLDVPGKDIYLGTTDQQLKGIGRIIEAGVKDEPGGSQLAAEKVLNGVWHGDKSFVHRLTGQAYNPKMDESPKTLVDLIAANAAGKDYAGAVSKNDLFNQIKLDKDAHQLRFDVNKGAVDARYNVDQRSGVIFRENELLTERHFAESLKEDIALAKKHVGE